MTTRPLFTALAAMSLLLAASINVVADDTSSCGLEDSGDCYEINGSPGCSDENCCLLVCNLDIFCCKETWDDTCVGYANVHSLQMMRARVTAAERNCHGK